MCSRRLGQVPDQLRSIGSERLFVAVDRIRGAGTAATCAAATAGAPAIGGIAAAALDLNLRPAQARSEFVRDHFGDAALLAFFGVIRALLETTGDDDAIALVQAGGRVLAEIAPGDHVEERNLFLPFTVLLIATVDRETETGDAPPGGGVAQLGILGEVPDECDGVFRCHEIPLLLGSSGGCRQAAVTPMPRRAASASGSRMSLGRTTASARRSVRSSSSSEPPGARTSATM